MSLWWPKGPLAPGSPLTSSPFPVPRAHAAPATLASLLFVHLTWLPLLSSRSPAAFPDPFTRFCFFVSFPQHHYLLTH